MNKLLTRSLSAVVYAVIVLGGTLFSAWILLLFIVLLNYACFNELTRLVTKYSEAKIPIVFHLILISFAVILFGLLWLMTSSISFYWLFIILPVIQFLPSLFSTKQNLSGSVLIIASTVLISLPLTLMLVLGTPHFSFSNTFLLAAIIFTWVNDSFAYFTGSLLGKHKLAVNISPLKTIEGFAGGILFTLAAGYLFSILSPGIPLFHWFVLAFLASLSATFGDLAESLFKRHYQLKDSGKIMPGHGGFLDRIDSILFVIPAFVVYLKIFALL